MSHISSPIVIEFLMSVKPKFWTLLIAKRWLIWESNCVYDVKQHLNGHGSYQSLLTRVPVCSWYLRFSVRTETETQLFILISVTLRACEICLIIQLYSTRTFSPDAKNTAVIGENRHLELQGYCVFLRMCVFMFKAPLQTRCDIY